MKTEIRDFLKSEERAAILLACKDILNCQPQFVCYSDGIFDFELELEPNVKTVFSFAVDDSFSKYWNVAMMLDMKGISFFDFKIVDTGNGNNVIDQILFRPLLEEEILG